MRTQDFENDLIIILLKRECKELIQDEAEKKHTSLSHFCLNKILEGIKK